MARCNPFEAGLDAARAYDAWFARHPAIFDAETACLARCFEQHRRSVEIGAGTGMFARRLGIGLSIEPAEAMARLCREKGVPVVRGVAEALPLDSGAFGLVAMITVECFLEDVGRALAEAARILEAQGVFVLAFLNRDTPLGRAYELRSADDPVYRFARFRTAAELKAQLEAHGFRVEAACQTVKDFGDSVHEVHDGTGSGIFTVFKAIKTCR